MQVCLCVLPTVCINSLVFCLRWARDVPAWLWNTTCWNQCRGSLSTSCCSQVQTSQPTFTPRSAPSSACCRSKVYWITVLLHWQHETETWSQVKFYCFGFIGVILGFCSWAPPSGKSQWQKPVDSDNLQYTAEEKNIFWETEEVICTSISLVLCSSINFFFSLHTVFSLWCDGGIM